MDKFNLENWCEEVPAVVHNHLEQIVKGQVEGEKVIKMKRKTSYKKVVVISLAATMLLGTTVFADEIYNIMIKREGYKTEIINEAAGKTDGSENDTESMKNVSESENATDTSGVVNAVEEFAGYDYVQLKFGYMPAGFVADREVEKAKLEAMGALDPFYEPDGITKYHNAQGESISPIIYKMDDESLIGEIKYTKDIEEHAFEGKKVYIISTYTINKDASDKQCYIFFENSNYYVNMRISGGVLAEDMLKLVENCSLEGTNEKWIEGGYVQAISKVVSLQDEEEGRYAAESYDVESNEKLFERFYGIGDTVILDDNEFTLNSVECIDSINGYDRSKFAFDLEDVWFDEEGKPLPRHIQIVKSGDGINSIDEVIEEKDIPVKILRVNMTVKVNDEGDKDGVYVTPFLMWDGLEENYLPEGAFESGRRKDDVVIYNELATDNKKGMTYAWLNKGDVVTYELLYIVDEADIGHLGLSFLTSPDSNEVAKASFDIR